MNTNFTKTLMLFCSIFLFSCRTAKLNPNASATVSKDAQVDIKVKIPKEKALEIALKKLRSEPFAKSFEINRYFMTVNATKNVYNVDFAHIGSPIHLKRSWVRGYLVSVNASSGNVEHAQAYKR